MNENSRLLWIESLQESLPSRIYDSLSGGALDDLIGESIPPYQIKDIHAVGGFSAIYTAERFDDLLARKVAVKVDSGCPT